MQRKTQLKFITKLSHKYSLNPKVIEVVCNHPFVFTAQRIREQDPKPIRFMYLGKIKMKNKHDKTANTIEENTK